jgi:hypothetical protein
VNFTEKLVASVEAQKAEIEELKTAMAAIAAKLNPPKPASADTMKPAPLKETFEELEARIHKRAADHKALEARYLEAMTVGCEPGTYRDPCGILRQLKDGKVVPTGKALEIAKTKAAAHEKAVIAEDFAWRKSVELPWRGDLPSEADDE